MGGKIIIPVYLYLKCKAKGKLFSFIGDYINKNIHHKYRECQILLKLRRGQGDSPTLINQVGNCSAPFSHHCGAKGWQIVKNNAKIFEILYFTCRHVARLEWDRIWVLELRDGATGGQWAMTPKIFRPYFFVHIILYGAEPIIHFTYTFFLWNFFLAPPLLELAMSYPYQ